jgi:hypothetical protein
VQKGLLTAAKQLALVQAKLREALLFIVRQDYKSLYYTSACRLILKSPWWSAWKIFGSCISYRQNGRARPRQKLHQ